MKKINFKEDDIIIAFRPGFYKAIKIIKRFEPLNGRGGYLEDPEHPNCGEEINSLIEYQKVYDESGNPDSQSYTDFCDSEYCELAINKIEGFIAMHERVINALKNLKL